MRRIQPVFRWLDCVVDFWIARGAGSHRYLYVAYVPDHQTSPQEQQVKVHRACSIFPRENTPVRAFNLENEEDRHDLSMTSALISIRDGVASLPTLFDARSMYLVHEHNDRLITLMSHVRSRLPMSWAGRWVIVQTTEYRGDLGFVRTGPDIYWDWLSSCRGSWVEVLVVPRVFNDPALREYNDSPNENGKRRPTQDHRGSLPKRLRSFRNADERPEPQLFKQRGDLTLANEGRHWQVYEEFKDVVFGKDLVVIRVPVKGLKLALMTPPQSRMGFLASENQEIDLKTLPPPSICTLEEDERIFHRPTRWIGYMVEWLGDTVLAYNVVDGDREERILPTSEINKYFDVGEYIEVIGRDESIEGVLGSGWVIQNIPGALLEVFSHRSTAEGHTGEISDINKRDIGKS